MTKKLPTGIVIGFVVLAALALAQPDSVRSHVHRDGFSSREPVWTAGDTNVKVAEKDHRIVTSSYFNAPSSEYLKIEAAPAAGKADAEFIHYYYETPACLLVPGPGAEASASLWMKSFRSGIQLRARVVLPKERDPKTPEAPLTTVIVGDVYPEDRVRSWHKLTLGKPIEALKKQLPVLRAQLGREIDPTGAYIDRLVLNVYAGPGVTELWIDDLDIGPCIRDPKKPLLAGRTVGRSKEDSSLPLDGGLPSHPYSVEFQSGRFVIDKKPFFMRAVRHSGQSLKGLRDFNFNTIAFPATADPELVDEAVVKNSFMVIAEVPVYSSGDGKSEVPIVTGRDSEKLSEHFRRFRSGDGVLLWDFGSGRTTEQLPVVSRTADVLRTLDPRRPRGVDLWDGYSAYSEYLDVIGSHRWPLFTSLEVAQYREWLLQRRSLTAPGKLMWTWVQTHMPEWYLALATGDPTPKKLDSPLGPQPEQIRILTYLGLASGYRGLGFWTDQFLSPDLSPDGKTGLGRDRMIELFFLNTELELLEPVLHSVQDEKTLWVKTSNNDVKAAVLSGKKGTIVLPVWVGSGTQYCADQGAVDGLIITVPGIPDGADPWLLTPASYENLRATGNVRPVPGGVEITIPKFDLTAAIVFTNDLSADGLVVRWQDNIRNGSAKRAAQLGIEQARDIIEKVRTVHEQLERVAKPVRSAEDYFTQARYSMQRAYKAWENGQPDVAYRESRAALRPIRILMREHWKNAVEGLVAPTSSPYAISFYTLPLHWELARQMQSARSNGNVLQNGSFELSENAPKYGAAVKSLPGWTSRSSTLDFVSSSAAIVNADEVTPDERKPGDPSPQPTLGRQSLQLFVGARYGKDDPEKKKFPLALERVSLAVDSPAVKLPPGTWVRISFWARVKFVYSSPDGVLVFDNVGSEPLAIRLYGETKTWKQYSMYRQVGPEGAIAVTFAMTGIGLAHFDDVRIEPLSMSGTGFARKDRRAP